MKKMLLATGQDALDNIIESKIAPQTGHIIVGKVSYKSELLNSVELSRPDILIISKLLSGTEIPLLELLLTLKQRYPKVRIVYLAGAVDEKQKEKMRELGTLVLSGIYDILHERKLSTQVLARLIESPKTREQVQYLTKEFQTNVIYEDEIVGFEEEAEVEDIEEDGYKHVFMVSSIKPGTGKSFISTNLATAIARYGVKKENGQPPKVALIEADLQNLSVGTLLQIEDSDRNILTAIKQIATIIDDEGQLTKDVVKIKTVNAFIKSCFKPYYHAKNLYAIVGSQLLMSEVENVNPYHYIYLIDSILDEFDVIIIDSNSSLAHVTTYPLLRLCHTAFYVLNLDFNNIRNNSKYQETLAEIEVFDKVKYVLNEDITKESRSLTGRDMLESLSFDSGEIENAGFDLVARVPEIPKEIFLNRLYEGRPIILDDSPYTLKARIEISTIANGIWDIDNLSWLQHEYGKHREQVLGPDKKKKVFLANKTKKGNEIYGNRTKLFKLPKGN